MLGQNWFVPCVVRPHPKAKVFANHLNCHTQRLGEKPAVKERGEMQCKYRDYSAHFLKQFLLEGINSVALGCSHKRCQK